MAINYGPMLPEFNYQTDDLPQQQGMTSVPRFQDFNQAPQTINSAAPRPMAAPNPMGDMLEHYTQAAKQFSSPYLMLPGNSWLAQSHPGVAGALDSAMAAVALTKQGAPASAGMNISAAMGGALEANQMRRQQQLQTAMLPYHMMMPQLQAQHLMAETEQEQAMAEYHRGVLPAMTNWRNAQANLAGAKVGQIADKPSEWKTLPGSYMDPQSNRTYVIQTTPDGQSRVLDPLLGVEADPETQLRVQQHASANPFTPAGITGRMSTGDPRQDAVNYQRITGGIAGAHAAATSAVTEPIKNADTFRTNELKRHQEADPEVPKYEQFATSHKDDIDFKLAELNGQGQDYYNRATATARAQRDARIAARSQYEKSGAWKNGTPIDQTPATQPGKQPLPF